MSYKKVLKMDKEQIFKCCTFMGQIKMYDKPCFSTLNISSSFLSQIKRKYWHKEDRYVGLIYMEQLYQSILSNWSIIVLEEKGFEHLNRVMVACNNLSVTYQQDKNISIEYLNFSKKFLYLMTKFIQQEDQPIIFDPKDRQQEMSEMKNLCQSYYNNMFENICPPSETRSKILYPFLTFEEYQPKS